MIHTVSKILVINSGSSSLKFQLFDSKKYSIIAKWIVEKIWLPWSFIEYEVWGKKIQVGKGFKDHQESLNQIFDFFVNWESKVLSSLDEINAIWHRVVHGWEYFSDSCIITDEVIEKIKECSILAPLHNPANLIWILACQKLMPKILQVAVFDTAFHQTMLPENFLYAIPYKYYLKYKIRKYWFHGTSHKYIYERLLEIEEENDYVKMKKNEMRPIKVITCHLWNGDSVTAIENGKVVDTSMWFTPLEWLVMWTRSWDLDPAVVTFLMKKENFSPDQIENILNKKSWLLWLSTKSSDMRDIIEWYKIWDQKSVIAMNLFVNRLIKYIWAYIAMLGWVDFIVFSGWILERSSFVRKLIIDKLWWLWIKLDEKANEVYCEEKTITTPDSKVRIIVVPTNEEYMIAKETYNLVSQ